MPEHESPEQPHDRPADHDVQQYTETELGEVAHKLDTELGPYYGNIFLTAMSLFPDFDWVHSVGAQFNHHGNGFFYGLDQTGRPFINVDLSDVEVTPVLRQRMVRRFGVPDDPEQAPATLLRRFVFAHELAHAVQDDPNFEEHFGPIDKIYYPHDTDYGAYVESDREANADYIAKMIIAGSELGQTINYPRPAEEPNRWRDWAAQHRVIDSA